MSQLIPDQHIIWNEKHGADEHAGFRGNASELAKKTENFLLPNAHILELGCGNGRDSVYLAGKGFKVLSTDFSEVVIEQNKQLFTDTKATFSVLNLESKLPFDENSFDAVYASLSLHYFLDRKTREIVKDIHRVIKKEGLFAFSCKEADSVRTDTAEKVEENLYIGKGGHALRLFSKEYTLDILNTLFSVELLEEVEETYVGHLSKIMYCIARKI